MNLEFLLRVDPEPSQALPALGGARFVVARRPGMDPAGGRLHERLAALPAFEATGPARSPWSVFRAR